jgi:hypothetical protein
MLSSCPRKSMVEKPFTMSGAPFLDVSIWSSTGNTNRRCRCRRDGFEMNSSTIAVRWRNGGDTFPVRFPANRTNWQVPRGGKVKRHPVTSATVARVRILDERAGSSSSPIQTYKQSWISTAATTFFSSCSSPLPPPPVAVEESCLSDQYATVCCADELPTHVGVRSESTGSTG